MKETSLTIMYLVIGIFTYAWIVETETMQTEVYMKTSKGRPVDERDKYFAAVFGGLLWPLYWSGKAASTVVHSVLTSRECP